MQRATRRNPAPPAQTDLFDRPGPANDAQTPNPAEAGRAAAPSDAVDPGGARVGPGAPHAPFPAQDDDMAGLRAALERVAFAPLADGVRSVADGLYVLGLHSDFEVDRAAVTRRFRDLALVYHPDTGALPSAARMAQLVDARDLLIRHLGRRRSRLVDLLMG